MKKMMTLFAGLLLIFAVAAMLAGCSVTKVEYNQNDKGETSYRIYRNSHWLKTDAEGLRGGMTEKGRFEIALDGVKASPSEEFNRTMQTYTSAFIQLAQIAAAAYNPSASAAMANMQGGLRGTEPAIQDGRAIQDGPAIQDGRATTNGVERAIQDGGATTNGVECAGGSCENK